MTDFRLPIAAGVALVSGPWMFWRGFRALRTCQLIENTPTAHIRSAAMGLAELRGKIRERSQTFAPFSGRPCAYWEVDIAVRGRNRGSWSTIHRNASGNPFFIQDESGVALVYPHGADCKVRFGTDEECYGLNLPEVYAAYLKEHSSLGSTFGRLSWMRFRERTLEEDMLVFVLGTAMPRSRAISVNDDAEALAATGTDGLGDRRRHELDEETAAIIRRGENERTFIISQESERDLVFGLKVKAAAMIWGGPLLALFGLGYWLMAIGSHRTLG
jgi:hypothetical protein